MILSSYDEMPSIEDLLPKKMDFIIECSHVTFSALLSVF